MEKEKDKKHENTKNNKKEQEKLENLEKSIISLEKSVGDIANEKERDKVLKKIEREKVKLERKQNKILEKSNILQEKNEKKEKNEKILKKKNKEKSNENLNFEEKILEKSNENINLEEKFVEKPIENIEFNEKGIENNKKNVEKSKEKKKEKKEKKEKELNFFNVANSKSIIKENSTLQIKQKKDLEKKLKLEEKNLEKLSKNLNVFLNEKNKKKVLNITENILENIYEIRRKNGIFGINIMENVEIILAEGALVKNILLGERKCSEIFLKDVKKEILVDLFEKDVFEKIFNVIEINEKTLFLMIVDWESTLLIGENLKKIGISFSFFEIPKEIVVEKKKNKNPNNLQLKFRIKIQKSLFIDKLKEFWEFFFYELKEFCNLYYFSLEITDKNNYSSILIQTKKSKENMQNLQTVINFINENVNGEEIIIEDSFEKMVFGLEKTGSFVSFLLEKYSLLKTGRYNMRIWGFLEGKVGFKKDLENYIEKVKKEEFLEILITKNLNIPKIIGYLKKKYQVKSNFNIFTRKLYLISEKKTEIEDFLLNIFKNDNNLNIENNKECQICFGNIQENEEIIKLSCLHEFHKECLDLQTKFYLENSEFPIVCVECRKGISIKDLELLFNSEEINEISKKSYKDFVNKNLNIYKWCPSPDCEEVYKVPEKIDNLPLFICSKTKNKFCKNCRGSYHIGFNCEEIKELNFGEILNLASKGILKRCPKCGEACEKISGCNHVVCSTCRIHFCFQCANFFSEQGSEIYAHMRKTHGGIGT